MSSGEKNKFLESAYAYQLQSQNARSEENFPWEINILLVLPLNQSELSNEKKKKKTGNLVQMLPAMGMHVIELCRETVNHIFIWLIMLKSRVWWEVKVTSWPPRVPWLSDVTPLLGGFLNPLHEMRAPLCHSEQHMLPWTNAGNIQTFKWLAWHSKVEQELNSLFKSTKQRMSGEEQGENVHLPQRGEVRSCEGRGGLCWFQTQGHVSHHVPGEQGLPFPTVSAASLQVAIWLASPVPCGGDAFVGVSPCSSTASWRRTEADRWLFKLDSVAWWMTTSIDSYSCVPGTSFFWPQICSQGTPGILSWLGEFPG